MGYYGYSGRLVQVDLSARKAWDVDLSRSRLQLFIGGSGLGTSVLWEHTTSRTAPFDEGNPLIFATGPFTGSGVFSSDRFCVLSRSPLTGIFAESSVGGYWGGLLKRSGIDVLMITGKSQTPVYLSVDEHGVKFHDAAELWGKDTFSATDELMAAFGRSARVAVIGPAGENLVPMANIVTDGRHGRVAGRCGLGAVMGSKKLKAVVAHGQGEVRIADRPRLHAILRSVSRRMRTDTVALREYGTSAGIEYLEDIGNLPVRNWARRSWKEGAQRISGVALARDHLVRRYHCGKCIISCGRVVQSVDGPFEGQEIAGPEYETISLLGSNCMIDDLRVIIRANELCNRYGIDTMSVGGAIGFAMELYERGLVSRQELDGIDMVWGSGDALIRMIDAIAYRRGFGAVLGQGVRKAAQTIGGIAEEFAIEVKGLEFPGHDPRSKSSVALAYATSNRGACHMSSQSQAFDGVNVLEDLGVPCPSERLGHDGKALYVAQMQNLAGMMDSLVCCKFCLPGGFTVTPLVEALNAVTGWEMDRNLFFRTGERIFALKRLYNVRLGVSRKDDVLPSRILTDPGGRGAEELPPLNRMLHEYYRIRGWDEIGRPNKAKLTDLKLSAYAEGVYEPV